MEYIIDIKCADCGESINPEEWGGWYEIGSTELGLDVKVPICNSCNLRDDGVSGAY